MSPPFAAVFVLFVKQREALPARHSTAIVGRDVLHLRTVRGFLVSRVAYDHAVRIECVQIAFLSSVPEHRRYPDQGLPPRKPPYRTTCLSPS